MKTTPKRTVMIERTRNMEYLYFMSIPSSWRVAAVLSNDGRPQATLMANEPAFLIDCLCAKPPQEIW
jgi:hypothetical protein